jgi:hypothetical protein
MPRLGVYAVVLADTEFQKIGEENWLKRKIKPRKFRGFWVLPFCNGEQARF